MSANRLQYLQIKTMTHEEEERIRKYIRRVETKRKFGGSGK
jgi:hypothetical protein